MWGGMVRPLQSFDICVHNGALIDGKQVILSSSISSSLQGSSRHDGHNCKEPTSSHLSHTEQHLFSDLPYWFSDGKKFGVTSYS